MNVWTAMIVSAAVSPVSGLRPRSAPKIDVSAVHSNAHDEPEAPNRIAAQSKNGIWAYKASHDLDAAPDCTSAPTATVPTSRIPSSATRAADARGRRDRKPQTATI